MKRINILSLLSILALTFFLASCDKTKPYDVEVPPAQAHFVGKEIQLYAAETNPAPEFKLQVGTTDVSGSDRTVTYKAVCLSGAVAGTQYNIPSGNTSGTITIKAGEAIGEIAIQADYASYVTGRKDTLMFSLTEPSVKPATFMDTVYVIIRGACFEGNVNLDNLLGDYNNTNENFLETYGPYTTSITSVNQTSATTGTIVVENIFDNGWAPITFTLDWTNPANRKVTLATQTSIGPATTVSSNPAYATWLVMVGPSTTTTPAGPGTFSICNQTLTLKMFVGLTDPTFTTGGWFHTLYTVNMAR
jgi:hypothetical protein